MTSGLFLLSNAYAKGLDAMERIIHKAKREGTHDMGKNYKDSKGAQVSTTGKI